MLREQLTLFDFAAAPRYDSTNSSFARRTAPLAAHTRQSGFLPWKTGSVAPAVFGAFAELIGRRGKGAEFTSHELIARAKELHEGAGGEKRQEDTFRRALHALRDDGAVYFECVDQDRGIHRFNGVNLNFARERSGE